MLYTGGGAMNNEICVCGYTNEEFSGDRRVFALGLFVLIRGGILFPPTSLQSLLRFVHHFRQAVISLLYQNISAMCPLCARLLLAHQTYSQALKLC